jgi:hypothetical protein
MCTRLDKVSGSACWHITVVKEVQDALPQTANEIADDIVTSNSPKPSPDTVTEAPPHKARLIREEDPTGASNVKVETSVPAT